MTEIANDEKQPAQDNCAGCCYFKRSAVNQGHCRRYPPQMVSYVSPNGPVLMPMFVVTGSNEWCGEFDDGSWEDVPFSKSPNKDDEA